jgi:hypothetical protein
VTPLQSDEKGADSGALQVARDGATVVVDVPVVVVVEETVIVAVIVIAAAVAVVVAVIVGVNVLHS